MEEAGVAAAAAVAVVAVGGGVGGVKAALCLYQLRVGEGRRPGTGWWEGGHSTSGLEMGRLGIEDIQAPVALVVALATHCKRLRVDIFR